MRKGLFFIFAALLVVGLPLSALAGTEVYKVKDAQYTLWDGGFCFTYPDGPAGVFNRPSVCIAITDATTSETVRVKYPKNALEGTQPDVGWNRIGHGTVTIYDPQGTYAFSVASFADRVIGARVATPSVWGEVLYTGPFQLEEVVQDDGNKVGCWMAMGDELSFEKCMSDQYDYVMFHWKLTGNSLGAFWKTTVKNGQMCFDNSWQNECYPVQQW
jgi:hypothetical protein